MTCGCGQSYIVSEDYGYDGRRRKTKDKSFKYFITVMFVVLLVFLTIYCIILVVSKKSGNNLNDVETTNKTTENALKSLESNFSVESNFNQTIVNNATTHSEGKFIPNNSGKTTIAYNSDINITQEKIGEIAITPESTVASTEMPSQDERAFERTAKFINDYKMINKMGTIEFSVTEPEFKATIFNISGSQVDVKDTEHKDNESTHTYITRPFEFSEILISNKSTNLQVVNETATKTNTDITGNVSIHETEVTRKDDLIVPKLVIYITTTNVPEATSTLEVGIEAGNEINDSQSTDATTNKEENRGVSTTAYFLTLTPNFLEPNSTTSFEQTRIKSIKETQSKNTEFALKTSDSAEASIVTDKQETEALFTFTAKTHIEANQRLKSDILKDNNTFSNSSTPRIESPNISNKKCQTSECKTGANAILQRMDHSADPCEYFYQFSCGGATSTKDTRYSRIVDVLLETLYKTKDLDDEFKHFRMFFNSCVKYENDYGYPEKIEQVLRIDIPSDNLTILLTFLMQRQSTPLFEINLGMSEKTGDYRLQMLPSNGFYDSIILNDWSLESHVRKHCSHISDSLKYEDKVKLPSVHEQYKKCQNEAFTKLAKNVAALKRNGKKEFNDDILTEFLNFFLNKKQISGIDIQNSIRNSNYTEISIEDLNKKYGFIDWLVLYRSIFGDTVQPQHKVYLFLKEEYFENLFTEVKKRLIKNEDQVIQILMFYYQIQLYQNIMAPKEDSSQFCMKQTIQLMPHIAEKIFFKKSGVANAKDHFKMIFEELIYKYKRLIDSCSNLEETEKEAIKLVLTRLDLRFMDDIDSLKEITTKDSEYLSNLFQLLENRRSFNGTSKSMFEHYVRRVEVTGLPTFFNISTIVIPNEFIYRSLQDRNRPSYVRETYINFHLGRSIAIYLQKSNLEMSLFKQFKNGLNTYFKTIEDVRLWRQNIEYTQDSDKWEKVVESSTEDRTADSIALQIAFSSISFKARTVEKLPWISEDYSPEQQFFILAAQEFCEYPTLSELAQKLYETPHIPGVFRIDAMIRNSRDLDFEAVFQCPKGSRMNPQEKIEFDSFIAVDYDYNNNNNNYEEPIIEDE